MPGAVQQAQAIEYGPDYRKVRQGGHAMMHGVAKRVAADKCTSSQ